MQDRHHTDTEIELLRNAISDFLYWGTKATQVETEEKRRQEINKAWQDVENLTNVCPVNIPGEVPQVWTHHFKKALWKASRLILTCQANLPVELMDRLRDYQDALRVIKGAGALPDGTNEWTEYMTIVEMAREINVSTKTVSRWIAKKESPHEHLGEGEKTRIRIPKATFAQWAQRTKGKLPRRQKDS